MYSVVPNGIHRATLENRRRPKMTINSDAVLIINANVLSVKVSRHILAHAILWPHGKSQKANGQGRDEHKCSVLRRWDSFLPSSISML